MKRVVSDRERAQRAAARLRVLQHFEQVTHNVSRTCRFFRVSRTLFYEWRRRYQRDGLPGLRPRLQDSPESTAYYRVELTPDFGCVIVASLKAGYANTRFSG